MAYLGNSPGVASQRVVTTFTATAGQTVFTPQSGYTLGYCDVFLNGIKLVNGDDYTASNGTSITLASGAAVGDSVEVVAYFPRGLSDGYLKAEADALLAQKQSSLGYTPVNKAGDTMTGNLTVASYLNTANGSYIGAGNYLVSGGGSADTGILTSGNILFATNGGAGNYERMRIDSAGRVMKPYQPSFQVRGSGGDIAVNAGVVDFFTSVVFNRGGHYNASNGRFTAPVTGVYCFFLGIFLNGGTEDRFGIRINGGGKTDPYFTSAKGGAQSGTLVMYLNANEYVDIFAQYGGATLYRDHCGWGGFLLG